MGTVWASASWVNSLALGLLDAVPITVYKLESIVTRGYEHYWMLASEAD